MPKGTVLTKDVKRIISEIYLKHPKWKTHETHKEVLRQVQQRIQYAEPGWPGYSVVQKELVKIRKRDEERSPESKRLDEAWVFSDLSKYPISSESMSLLISIYDKCWYENMLLGADTDEWLLSVREALWVGR